MKGFYRRQRDNALARNDVNTANKIEKNMNIKKAGIVGNIKQPWEEIEGAGIWQDIKDKVKNTWQYVKNNPFKTLSAIGSTALLAHNIKQDYKSAIKNKRTRDLISELNERSLEAERRRQENIERMEAMDRQELQEPPKFHRLMDALSKKKKFTREKGFNVRGGYYKGYKYDDPEHWTSILKDLIKKENFKGTWKQAVKDLWKPYKKENPNKTKFTKTKTKAKPQPKAQPKAEPKEAPKQDIKNSKEFIEQVQKNLLKKIPNGKFLYYEAERSIISKDKYHFSCYKNGDITADQADLFLIYNPKFKNILNPSTDKVQAREVKICYYFPFAEDARCRDIEIWKKDRKNTDKDNIDFQVVNYFDYLFTQDIKNKLNEVKGNISNYMKQQVKAKQQPEAQPKAQPKNPLTRQEAIDFINLPTKLQELQNKMKRGRLGQWGTTAQREQAKRYEERIEELKKKIEDAKKEGKITGGSLQGIINFLSNTLPRFIARWTGADRSVARDVMRMRRR